MNDPTPTFAIVGAVNHGKSSVVSTLAEDDQVRISRTPGETMQSKRFWLLDLFIFYDTPGFQNAREALAELAVAANAREPLSVFRDFVARHRSEGEANNFKNECELFQPILDGAGVVYVVDGSEPLIPIHAAEMEILRLTGQPRLAIINRTSHDNHIQEWKRKLGLHFNAVREFNAHHATFADRLELLETLAGIEQSWKPKLTRAVAIFRDEGEKRLRECAEIIVEILIASLTHREVALADTESSTRRENLADELKQRFMTNLSQREEHAHKEIITLFRHTRVESEFAAEHLFDTELFSDETWRAFGLDQKQLIVAGAIGGAAAGAAVDVFTVGHTLLAGAAIGGAIGAAGAFMFGKNRPELKVTMPGLGQTIQLGGSAMSVGPYPALNFPWILLDRAFGVVYCVINRAHAQRDNVTIRSELVKSKMEEIGVSTSKWDPTKRKECERSFALIRKGKLGQIERSSLLDLIRERLTDISNAKPDSIKSDAATVSD